MRKILYAVFLFGCCASLLSGCIKEKYTVPSEKGDALVQLNIGTRAVEETDGFPQTTRLFCTRCAYTLLLMDNRPDTSTRKTDWT